MRDETERRQSDLAVCCIKKASSSEVYTVQDPWLLLVRQSWTSEALR
jgi:hypothetical protein